MARAPKDATLVNQIYSIHNSMGSLEHTPKKIAEVFHDFYTKRYDFPPQHRPQHMQAPAKNFLTEGRLPSLCDEDKSDMNAPINATEH